MDQKIKSPSVTELFLLLIPKSMNKKNIMEKARSAREPIEIFNSDRYSITTEPYNYRIYIKLPIKSGFKTLGRIYYMPQEHGLKYAHDLAEETIKEYFIDYIQSQFNLKR